MARRGVLILLGCALGVAPSGAASGGDLARGPVIVAQLRAPVLAQAPATQQRPRLISLDFKDADINNILRILAEFSGLNIVTSDDVKGKVTVKLQNVPWQQALDSVVRASKLAYVQEGNIIRVDRLENLTKEAEAGFKAEQREVEIQQRRKEAELRLADQERAAALARQEFEVKRKQLDAQLAPLVEEVIQLRYGHVGTRRVYNFNFFTDAPETIEEKGVEDAITGGVKKDEGKAAGLLSPRGSVTIDQRTNSMIVRDVPENLARIRDFVAKVDRPSPQVQIEARIVEMARDDARTLGVVWGSAFTPRTGSNSPVIDVRGGAAPKISGDEIGSVPPSTAANFPALAPALTGFTATPFGLALGWLASNFALDIQIQALEGERRARLLSAPSLLTLENQPATMASGTDFPVVTAVLINGVLQPTVEFRDVTTRLAVTPRLVAGENRLLLNIAVKRESVAQVITAGSTIAPVVNTRSTVTQAEIPDGGTVVIAGLRDSTSQDEKQGLPWLSKIPVLGWLFKNDLTEARKSELVVFLTAKVVTGAGQAGVAPAQLPVSPGAPAAPGPQGKAPAIEPAVAARTVSAAPVAPVALPALPVARTEPRPAAVAER